MPTSKHRARQKWGTKYLDEVYVDKKDEARMSEAVII